MTLEIYIMTSSDGGTHFYPTTNWIPNEVLFQTFPMRPYLYLYRFSFMRKRCSNFDCIFIIRVNSLDLDVLVQFRQTKCLFRSNWGQCFRKLNFYNSKLTCCLMSLLKQLFLAYKLGYRPDFRLSVTTLFRPEAHLAKWKFSIGQSW